MHIDKTAEYTLITPDETSFLSFYDALIKNSLKGEHLIIDFSEKLNPSLKEILSFLNIANDYRENNTSFIIIASGFNIDDIPDEISIVPTLTEAIDILEMDAIERDLMGF